MAKKLSAAQVKARLADPGKRSTIPTSQLPAKYRTMRARAVASRKRTATLDDPAALTAPLTPRGLAEQVAASTDLAYSAPTQELQGQRGVNAQMQANIPAWFDGFQASLARATAVQQAATANAVAAQQNAANTTSALDTAQQGTQQASMAADAQSRGATVDPQIAATAQQAAMSRRGSMDAFTGLQAGLGAATVGLAANREVVGAGQRVTAQQAERNVGLNLDRTAQALATDKGNYATTFRQKLIDAEHTKQLENKAFNLDTEKAQADVNAKAAALADKRRARITSNANADASRAQAKAIADSKLTLAQRADQRAASKDATQRASRTGPYAPSAGANVKDAYGNSVKDRQRAQDAYDRANLLAAALPPALARKQGVEKTAAFLSSKGLSALNARAAAEKLVHGKVSAATAAKLAKRGVGLTPPKAKVKAGNP
jgi:phage gp46-like protein